MTSSCGLFCALAAACFAGSTLLQSEQPPRIAAPLYTAGTVVNAANPNVPALASNTIATIYGKDLAYETRTVTPEQISGGIMPTALPGAGTRVLVNNQPVSLYYASPDQINFVMPSLNNGTAEIRVSRDTLYGPPVRVPVASFSPALFHLDPEFVVATRVDGTLVDRNAPALRGEVIILWATGLGITRPPVIAGQIPTVAAPLENMRNFQVLIGPAAAELLYAGVAPGYPGLYQINLKLTAVAEVNPEVRVGFGANLSPAGVRLHAQPSNP